MLEQTAQNYFTSPDSRTLAYGLMIIIWAILATFTDRSHRRLNRWQFFLCGAGVMLLLIAVQQIGKAVVAMNGSMWPLMIGELTTCAAAGYVLGLVAMARCRDSFLGYHKPLAIIAVASILFSRLAFFALMLKPSMQGEEDSYTA